MKSPLIPKPVMILIGVCVIVVGIIVGVEEIRYQVDKFNYGYAYSTEFTESMQDIILTFVNFFQCIAGIMGGLSFIVPVWAGRKLYRTGYALSDEETIPKAYRSGGINLIIVGGIAIAVYAWIFSSYDYSNDIIFPIFLAIFGITGVISSISRKT